MGALSNNAVLLVGGTRLDASKATDRKELTHLLCIPGRVRALAHDGQAVLLLRLLGELDREQRAAILETPYAVYDLATCGAAEVATLIAGFSEAQKARVLGTAGAVSGLALEHRRAVWDWLEQLPSAVHDLILRSEGAVEALAVDSESAAMVADLIEALAPSVQLAVLHDTSIVTQLVWKEQSGRALALLSPCSGPELVAILSRGVSLGRLAEDGGITHVVELLSRIAPAERLHLLANGGVFFFAQLGQRALIVQWLLALDADEQRKLLRRKPAFLRALVLGAELDEVEKLILPLEGSTELGPEWYRQLGEVLAWLEAQPAPGSFSLSDRARKSALQRAAINGVSSRRLVAALTRLAPAQLAELLKAPGVADGLARGGAAEATARLLAELPQLDHFEILLQPYALSSLAREGAAPEVARLFDALPPVAQIRLLREVPGHWTRDVWPPQTLALKLVLLLGELGPEERFGLVHTYDHASLLVTHGYAAHVTELLDTASFEERAQLLAALGLVAALCESEGLAAVAARFESLPPTEQAWLLARHDALGGRVERGLAPTLFRLFGALTPDAMTAVLDIEHEILLSEPHPLLVEWRERLKQPADHRLRLVPRTST